ncbi:hypothetical protein BJX63DRAFT_369449 [Aspergillus granulosus]|uniref:Kinesin light chain n=1 Tax=Aspergillus granulosus TaxID=176169 RepID=A0ABR4H2Y8_9EURO
MSPRDRVNKLLHRGLDEEVEGNLNRANEHYLKAIKLAERALGPDDEETLTGQTFLATNYRKLYRHKEAENIDRDVLERYQRTLGEKHEDTIKAMGNLALDLKGQGLVDEAIQLQEKSVQLMMDVAGEDSEWTMQGVSNLANSYAVKRRYHNAAELHQKVLGWRKQILGREHAMTIIAMDFLGMDYRGLGQLELAVELQEEAVALAKTQLDPMHETTITCVLNLADTYLALDHKDRTRSSQQSGTRKAIEVLEEHLQAMPKAGDDYNPLLVGIMNNLAVAYMKVDRLHEAQLLLRTCHTWNEEMLGDDHPRSATTRQNLDLVMEKLGENSGK